MVRMSGGGTRGGYRRRRPSGRVSYLPLNSNSHSIYLEKLEMLCNDVIVSSACIQAILGQWRHVTLLARAIDHSNELLVKVHRYGKQQVALLLLRVAEMSSSHRRSVSLVIRPSVGISFGGSIFISCRPPAALPLLKQANDDLVKYCLTCA